MIPSIIPQHGSNPNIFPGQLKDVTSVSYIETPHLSLSHQHSSHAYFTSLQLYCGILLMAYFSDTAETNFQQARPFAASHSPSCFHNFPFHFMEISSPSYTVSSGHISTFDRLRGDMTRQDVYIQPKKGGRRDQKHTGGQSTLTSNIIHYPEQSRKRLQCYSVTKAEKASTRSSLSASQRPALCPWAFGAQSNKKGIFFCL